MPSNNSSTTHSCCSFTATVTSLLVGVRPAPQAPCRTGGARIGDRTLDFFHVELYAIYRYNHDAETHGSIDRSIGPPAHLFHLRPLPRVPPCNLVAEHCSVGLCSPLELGFVHDKLAHIGEASRLGDHLRTEPRETASRMRYRTSVYDRVPVSRRRKSLMGALWDT